MRQLPARTVEPASTLVGHPDDSRQSVRDARRQVPRVLLHIAPAISLYLWQILPIRGWLIDDAGISLAYARNLGAGHGLTSQPGLEAVEGFSNLLWTLILTPLATWLLPWMVPCLKTLSIGLVVGSLYCLYRLLVDELHRPGVFVLGSCIVAANPSFVIWTTSGLENPLLAFLVAATCFLLYRCLRTLLQSDSRHRPPFRLLAVTLAALALTRPDAILYFAAPPLLALIHSSQSRTPLGWAFKVLLVGGALLLAVAMWRYWYFGDLLPNTFYSKQGGMGDLLSSVLLLSPRAGVPVIALTSSVAPAVGPWSLIALLCSIPLLITRNHWRVEHSVFAVTTSLGLASFVLLRQDWMPEFRFGTGFLLLYPLFCTLILTDVLRGSASVSNQWEGVSRPVRVAALATLAGLFILLLRHDRQRLAHFAAKPTLPLAVVEERFGARFNTLAETLGVSHGSILLPDLGGTLLRSELRIYDLAGLVDRTIARSWFYRRDSKRFLDYVFEEARPSFIHVHDPWHRLTPLLLDPRFEQTYIGLWQQHPGRPDFSQDYVRRELASDPHSLEAAREVLGGPFR